MNLKILNKCALSFILSLVSFTAASKHYEITDVHILKDNLERYSPTELLKDSSINFQPFTPDAPKSAEKVFWLKFTYKNSDLQKSYYLSYAYILFKKIEIYYLVGDSLYHYEAGFSVPFDKRSLYSPNTYLKLPCSKDSVVCLLRIASTMGYSFFFNAVDLQLEFKEEIKTARFDYFVLGLGVLAVTFSLIFFIFLKDKLYMYYALYSLTLVLSRLTYSGYLYEYIHSIFEINSLRIVYSIYTIFYELVNVFIIFYFYEYLRYYKRSKWFTHIVVAMLCFKVSFMGIQLLNNIIEIFNYDSVLLYILMIANDWFNLFVLLFFIAVALRTRSEYRSPNGFALVSLFILIFGPISYILPSLRINWLGVYAYYVFVNIYSLEIFVFAFSIGYRHNFFRSEKNKAIETLVDTLKKSEQLKDELNKDLEIQVANRTKQISEMNDLLKAHNIELKSEIKITAEARVFQKNMSFSEFTNIFPDNTACYAYLAKLKWNDKENLSCRKCGYKNLVEVEEFNWRCGKCKWIESATSGTLFHKLRFPIQKAFYITYLVSSSGDSVNLARTSEEINLRKATIWAFKQKVIELIESAKHVKRHKDGWTHLIKFSITK
ncbi:MAG TPA: 7TM-DISM domain-containing protein [Cytophagaceae bacterium]|jgi:rubrerythrin